jgi:hypothetical protein
MSSNKALSYRSLGLIVLLVFAGVSLTAWYAYAQTLSAEKRQVLRSETFKIAAGEQKFKAFYLSAPLESFEVSWNVSEGSIKWSAWKASIIEDDHGYFDYWVNETTMEKVQTWFWNENHGTVGIGGTPTPVNEIWYLHFYNEDSYEKEVSFQVAKIWHGLF